jgi:lipid II:glycine glycyltransferase (peptidoglycan interpeptide bridge formation enzyme)
MYSFREVKNNLELEPFLAALRAPFTQSDIYAGWQTKREVRQFVIEKDGGIEAFFQLIKFPLIFGKSYYYSPYGPVVKEYSTELLDFLRERLGQIKEKDVVYIRLDFFPEIKDEKILSHCQKLFYKVPAFLQKGSNFQPRQEWFLNIEKSETELLEAMHKNTRYSIRTAEKKGVQVKVIKENFSTYFPDFYRLIEITAKRNNFTLHPEEYYKNIFSNLDKNNEGGLLVVASFGEEILVIDLIIVFAGTANYVFSGSSSENRNLMPAYLAQWVSILEAKKLGCREYNFGGVNLNKKGIENNWAGLSDYKVKFGGHLVTHPGFYDIVWQPLWYLVYNLRKLIKSK